MYFIIRVCEWESSDRITFLQQQQQQQQKIHPISYFIK